MSNNYYDLNSKSKLAQSLLLMVCAALTKAVRLGRDGKDMVDSITVVLIEATSKRNVLAEELECEEEKTRSYMHQQISLNADLNRMREERESMERQEAWDKQQELKAAFQSQEAANRARYEAEQAQKKILGVSEDISKAGDPNEVW